MNLSEAGLQAAARVVEQMPYAPPTYAECATWAERIVTAYLATVERAGEAE